MIEGGTRKDYIDESTDIKEQLDEVDDENDNNLQEDENDSHITPIIDEFINGKDFTREDIDLLKTTRSFCTDVTNDFNNTFGDMVELYKENGNPLPQNIVNYLYEKKYNIPHFIIANGEKAKDFLNDCGFNDHEIDKGNLLLIFHLPKPLTQYWWKGGENTWGTMSESVNGSVIEWGNFYRHLLPTVWNNEKTYEENDKLFFGRINDLGNHEAKKYYYLWEISKSDSSINTY